jgi:hypothetical protein
MPENIGSPSAPYNTRIPRIDENADIQTALRLYHYGDNTNNPPSIIANSVAGHLENLKNTTISRNPITILDNANLNNFTVTGFYNQPSVANARTGTNYPAYPDSGGVLRFYPGMLRVISDGAIVFQEYHMVGEVGFPINSVFWRYRFANVWSDWKGLVDSEDILEITDEQYYRKSNTYTRTEMDGRYSPRLFLETTPRTTNSSLVLEDINRVVTMNVSGGGTLTIPTDASVLFPVGSVINIYNISSGLLTIVGASGVTVRNLGSGGRLEQFKEASIRKRAVNEWVAAGPIY